MEVVADVEFAKFATCGSDSYTQAGTYPENNIYTCGVEGGKVVRTLLYCCNNKFCLPSCSCFAS